MKKNLNFFFALLLCFSVHFSYGQISWIDLGYDSVVSKIELNPMKGLMPGYDIRPGNTMPYTTDHFYISLKEINTARGVYDWSVFRSRMATKGVGGRHVVPRVWLFYPGNATGVPQYLITEGVIMYGACPDWNDTILNKALRDFIRAFAKEFDGNTSIALIEAGLYGSWGEWNIVNAGDAKVKEMSPLNMDSLIVAYGKAFKTTQIALRYADKPSTTTLARTVGYYDDSFCYETLWEPNWCFWSKIIKKGIRDIWKTHPISGEMRPELQDEIFESWPNAKLTRKKYWDPVLKDSVQYKMEDLQRCMDSTHISLSKCDYLYTQTPDPNEVTNAIKMIKKMGYQYYIRQYILTANSDGTVKVDVKIQNKGLAPLYYNWAVEIGAKNTSTGAFTSIKTTNWNINRIISAVDSIKTVTTNTLANGTYNILMRFVNPLGDAFPLRFANSTQDADRTGWLTLGTATISVGTTYTLTTTATNGAITRNPVGPTYPANTVVNLTATPNSGYTFTGWSGDLSGTTNPTTITMTANKSVTANFTAATTYTLTTTAVNGTITRNPVGPTYPANTVVNLTATPNSGYTFTGWSGDLSGTANPGSITMNSNKSVTANFIQDSGTTVFATNCGGSAFTAGDGTVYSADANFSGGTAYSTTDAIANTTDDALYQSERWGASSYNIPLANGSYQVTLKFAEINFTTSGSRVFNVAIEGAQVISNLDIFAQAGHDVAYDVTIPVTLNDGQLNISFIAVKENPKISAIKVKSTGVVTTYSLTTSATNGSVTLNPPGGTYNSGTVVAVTAIAASGYTFSSWSGDLSGSTNPTTITMNSNKNVTANFTSTSLPDVAALTGWISGTTNAKVAGSNRMMVVMVMGEKTTSFTANSVTYGGQAMTKVTEKSILSGSATYSAIFMLKEVGVNAATSGAIAVSWSATPAGSSIYSVLLANVDQTTTIVSVNNAISAATSITTSALAAASGDMVVMCGATANNNTQTFNNSFTKQFESNSTWGDGVGGSKMGTGVSETPKFTQSTSGRMVICAMVAKKSALKSASISSANTVIDNTEESNIQIYPNPVSSILNIDFTDAEISREIRVYNTVGQLIYFVQTKNATAQIDVQSLKLKGIVMVQVIADKSVSNHRVLVK